MLCDLEHKPKFLGAQVQRGAFPSSLGHLSSYCLLALLTSPYFLLSTFHSFQLEWPFPSQTLLV